MPLKEESTFLCFYFFLILFVRGVISDYLCFSMKLHSKCYETFYTNYSYLLLLFF